MQRFKATCAAMAACAMLISSIPAMAAEEGWTVDFRAARKAATSDKKDLLLEFTGSDWCPPCKALKAQIFDSEHFAKEAPNYFVLVKLDFPRDKSNQTQPEIAQNHELQKHYSISGYPTVILADEEGKPYARMVGFGRQTPEQYVENLQKLQGLRVKRDTAMAKAATADGLEKAKHLDEAIGGIDAELASSFYKPEVMQIIRLDAKDEAGLKTKYEGVLIAKEVKEKLQQIVRGGRQNPQQATAAIDALIAEKKLTGENLQQALYNKGVLVYQSDKAAASKHFEKALEAAPESQTAAQIKLVLEQIKTQQGQAN